MISLLAIRKTPLEGMDTDRPPGTTTRVSKKDDPENMLLCPDENASIKIVVAIIAHITIALVYAKDGTSTSRLLSCSVTYSADINQL